VGPMKAYPLSDFDKVPSRKESMSKKLQVKELPSIEAVKAEARWTIDMTELFEKEQADVEDRSGAMSRMAYSGAELGWNDEQILAALYDMDGRWKKYTARRPETRDNIMLNFVNRAREKYGYSDFDVDLSKWLGSPNIPVEDEESGAEPLVWGFKSFVEAEFKIDWLFEGLMAKGGIGLITGYPGTGKTQFAIQLCAYAALGYDRFLKWDAVGGSKKALFLSLEMSKPPLNLFMSTIAGSYPDLDTLERNFKIDPFGKPLPLDTKEGQAYLNNMLERTMPDLLVIDSLQRSISKEMTDELAAKNLMHYLAMVRDKYKCAVVMIHHNRKKSAEAKKTEITQLSDVYGSIFFTADVDFVISLDKLNPDMLGVHTVKNRLGREPMPFEIWRDDKLHFSAEFENVTENFPQREKGGTLDV
jgi:hypothetical protein